MREFYLVLAVAALIVLVSTAYKISLLLREQRTTNELLRELLKK
jgi:signal transduction histidine kinase